MYNLLWIYFRIRLLVYILKRAFRKFAMRVTLHRFWDLFSVTGRMLRHFVQATNPSPAATSQQCKNNIIALP